MSLPDISRLDPNTGAALSARFSELGVTRHYIRRMTERGDDLRTPLTATRATSFLDDPAALTLRLFFCGECLPPEIAVKCLGNALLEAVLESGVLVENAGGLRAPFHLRTVRGLYLFSDYLGGQPDAVMGAGETTAVLYRASFPPEPIDSALDLGCGAGTLALLLAARARRVVGTDINPRAIALARFNTAVNGIRNVEFRVGGLYSPVPDERFDSIVSQPPYYPNPSPGAGRQVLLHGGERGDELAVQVVDGLPDHLTPSGRGLVFAAWSEDRERPQPAALRILELRSARRELFGARQSITIVEHASPGWFADFEVAADCWGAVEPRKIDSIMESVELVRGPRERLLRARLRLFAGATQFREDQQLFLQGPPESLIGLTALDNETGRLITAIDGAPDVQSAVRQVDWPLLLAALRRGLLSPSTT